MGSQEQIETERLVLDEGKRLVGRLGRDHIVSALLEDPLNQFSDALLVLHHEHGL